MASSRKTKLVLRDWMCELAVGLESPRANLSLEMRKAEQTEVEARVGRS